MASEERTALVRPVVGWLSIGVVVAGALIFILATGPLAAIAGVVAAVSAVVLAGLGLWRGYRRVFATQDAGSVAADRPSREDTETAERSPSTEDPQQRESSASVWMSASGIELKLLATWLGIAALPLLTRDGTVPVPGLDLAVPWYAFSAAALVGFYVTSRLLD